MFNAMYPFMPFRQMPTSQMPMDTNTYFKNLFNRLVGKRVDILLNGREGIFKNLLILKVDNGVVITEAENEICLIPFRFIATVFLPKDLAKELYQF
ncbi:hypothetical protein [Clostridium ganghwense]|uniref:Uncharacterized protein n=1 Tax=Clostridium ganghwense TaxID=312089 RepID=A0ABT4CQH6_9CLOT|nr:hypothetical protein [Clostridium ganghwense]MCY6371305.1 hypothetical protein [Clostridium ganghwense]